MVNSILLTATTAILAAAGTNALWLATANVDQTNYVNGGGFFPSPYCQVGKGNTKEEALQKATSITNGIAIIAGGHCDQLPYKHTNQLGGFWDDHGDVNYEDDNRHWYCKTGTGAQGACDAGDGAPKRKRDGVEKEFKA